MKLTTNNFCPNVKDESTAIRICYVCKSTGKICPRVDYSSGSALPDRVFMNSGCPLLVKEDTKKVKPVKEEIVEKSIEKVVSNNSIENKSSNSKPKTNNRKKKTTNNKK